LKRLKSEHKLIRARLLYKINTQQQLSQNDIEYAKKWAAGELRIDNKSTYTQLTLDELSTKDKSMLGEYCEVIPDIALTDLVLEYALFFDDEIIRIVENKLTKNSSSSFSENVMKIL
jgi:hypothetical protein